MWWLATTLSPLATATVLFSSAPTASTWRRAGVGRAIGSGAYPRGRRRCTRTTRRQSAVGPSGPTGSRRPPSRRSGCGWGGRGSRMASTMGPRRARASVSSWAIGSSDRLPLVMTSGPVRRRPAAGGGAGCRPASAPARAGRAPRPGPARRPGRGRSTMGRRGETRAASASGGEVAQCPGRPRRSTIRANGLSSRALRRRSSATASSVGGVAGQVVAAEALDGEDAAGEQQRHRRLQRPRRPWPARRRRATAG